MRILNPYDKARELAQAIREYDAFVQMRIAKDKLQDDVPAKEMLMEFQRTQLAMEKNRLLGQDVTQAEEEGFDRLNEIMQMNDLVRDYFTAEMQVGLMFQDIQQILGDVIQEASMLPEAISEFGL